MTPTELLAAVTAQFAVVYLTAPQQAAILENALVGYQDKAGMIRTVTTAEEDTDVAIPDKFLYVIGASDKKGNFFTVTADSVEDKLIIDDPGSDYPYEISYFIELAGWPSDEDLPKEIVGMLMDYLAVLIEIPNTRRARDVARNAGLQTEFPTDQELMDRKNAIEDRISENKAILPMFSVCT